LLDSGVDVVVLGCTHYPFLRQQIQQLCGPDVTLVDPSDAVARQLGRVLTNAGIGRTDVPGSTQYFTSGDAGEMEQVLVRLLGGADGPIEQAQI
jgi:glutamate racemase